MVGTRVATRNLPYAKPFSLSLYEKTDIGNNKVAAVICNDALGYNYDYPTDVTHMLHKNKWLKSVW